MFCLFCSVCELFCSVLELFVNCFVLFVLFCLFCSVCELFCRFLYFLFSAGSSVLFGCASFKVDSMARFYGYAQPSFSKY